MADKEIFRQVALASPDLGSLGGISAVADAYRRHIPGIHIVETNSRRGTVAGAFVLAWSLLKIPFLRAAGVRVLHAHGASGKSFVRKCMLMSWARLWGMKTVFHCHAGPFRDYVARVGTDYVARKLCKCDAVATLSKVHLPLFRDTLSLPRVFVINNMVEPSGFRRQYNAGKKVSFLFLGLLTGRKGIFELLDAAAILNGRYPGRFNIIVGGNGDESERFHRHIAELNIGGVIDYRGWLRGSGKEAALREADVTVLPSHAEGTPICILEGFDHGMPAVASDVGGIPDLVVDGRNGILTPVGDASALAEAMEKYIADPTLIEKHGRAGAKTVEAYYPDAVTERLAEIYSGIICSSTNG